METIVSKIKIAIVDAHRLFRQGILQILKRFSHFEAIIEAESIKQLMAEMALQLTDIILMDLECLTWMEWTGVN